MYCFAAILFVISLQICYVCIFEYLGGPIFGREVLENTPTPLFDQPLNFIAHGRIFESLRYCTLDAGPEEVK